MMHKIIHGNSLDKLKLLPENSVDAVVTDPPYELGFMGKGWDASGIAYSVPLWSEVLRVLKPGGHLLAFGGTRTHHRMTCAIEDAGFEIRDELDWLYGSGFPKSLDVSKAIDKAAGAEREVIGAKSYGEGHVQNSSVSIGFGGCDPDADSRNITAPATDEAKRWDGWGTALKPAREPIVLARKPFDDTVAANVLKHGTGALNIDGCRIALSDYDLNEYIPNRVGYKDGIDHVQQADADCRHPSSYKIPMTGQVFNTKGRWPANLILTHSDACELKEEVEAWDCAPDCPVRQLDEQSGITTSGAMKRDVPAYQGDSTTTFLRGRSGPSNQHGDTGGASRFFYVAKASRKERTAGLDGDNIHPTVKPIALMRYLCRLITPPGGLVLDPFAGSGTTGCAAALEGFDFIGIELEEKHVAIAKARIKYWSTQPAESSRPLNTKRKDVNVGKTQADSGAALW